MIAVIQLINKVCGLPFSWADEELAGAFAAQLAVCIANLRAMEDMSNNLAEARAETRLLAKLLASCRDLASRAERDPIGVCRRVRDLAKEYTSSMSSALLLYTEHEVAGGIAQRYCGVLGGGALERAVGCLLLAEPPEDVRHPPLSPEQEDALKQLTIPARAPMASWASLKAAMGASKAKPPWAGKSQAETDAMQASTGAATPAQSPWAGKSQAETDAMHAMSGSMKRSKRGRRLSASLAPSTPKGLTSSQPQRRASTLSVLSAELIRKRVGKVLEEAARAKPNLALVDSKSKWHAVRNASNEKLAEMLRDSMGAAAPAQSPWAGKSQAETDAMRAMSGSMKGSNVAPPPHLQRLAQDMPLPDQFEVLYEKSPLAEICHEVLQRRRPVSRSILEPCRPSPKHRAHELWRMASTEVSSLAKGVQAAGADGGGDGGAWGGDDEPPPPGKQVLAMAVPILVGRSGPAAAAWARQAAAAGLGEEGGANDEDKEEEGEVVAVLVVWQRVRSAEAEAAAEEGTGAEGAPPLPYGASDELILRTLASITGRLLLQDEEMTKLQRAYGEAEQRDHARRVQMQAIMQSVKQPGAQHTATLHASAQQLAAAIGCEWSLLWLVEHVYRGRGTQQQVVTKLRGETVTLPADLPASGRGLVGLALTTGKTTVVADALIAPHYHGDVDAAACALPDAQSAMCVVPLRDHYGQVLGVLQAAGKRRPSCAHGAEELNDSGHMALCPAEWAGVAPAFSSEDVDFLEIMAAKLAASLEVLVMGERGIGEMVDLQASVSELQAKVCRSQAHLQGARAVAATAASRQALASSNGGGGGGGSGGGGSGRVGGDGGGDLAMARAVAATAAAAEESRRCSTSSASAGLSETYTRARADELSRLSCPRSAPPPPMPLQLSMRAPEPLGAAGVLAAVVEGLSPRSQRRGGELIVELRPRRGKTGPGLGEDLTTAPPDFMQGRVPPDFMQGLKLPQLPEGVPDNPLRAFTRFEQVTFTLIFTFTFTFTFTSACTLTVSLTLTLTLALTLTLTAALRAGADGLAALRRPRGAVAAHSRARLALFFERATSARRQAGVIFRGRSQAAPEPEPGAILVAEPDAPCRLASHGVEPSAARHRRCVYCARGRRAQPQAKPRLPRRRAGRCAGQRAKQGHRLRLRLRLRSRSHQVDQAGRRRELGWGGGLGARRAGDAWGGDLQLAEAAQASPLARAAVARDAEEAGGSGACHQRWRRQQHGRRWHAPSAPELRVATEAGPQAGPRGSA